MEREQTNTLSVILIAVLLIWLSIAHSRMAEMDGEIAGLADEIYRLDNVLDDYSSAISEANSQIEDAQGYAWSSYDEMGDVLENLYTVDVPY
jgi:hypothetical protein